MGAWRAWLGAGKNLEGGRNKGHWSRCVRGKNVKKRGERASEPSTAPGKRGGFGCLLAALVARKDVSKAGRWSECGAFSTQNSGIHQVVGGSGECGSCFPEARGVRSERRDLSRPRARGVIGCGERGT